MEARPLVRLRLGGSGQGFRPPPHHPRRSTHWGVTSPPHAPRAYIPQRWRTAAPCASNLSHCNAQPLSLTRHGTHRLSPGTAPRAPPGVSRGIAGRPSGGPGGVSPGSGTSGPTSPPARSNAAAQSSHRPASRPAPHGACRQGISAARGRSAGRAG